jgi:hypothetical protein
MKSKSADDIRGHLLNLADEYMIFWVYNEDINYSKNS